MTRSTSETLSPELAAKVWHDNTLLLFDCREKMAVPAEYAPRCTQLREFFAHRTSWQWANPGYIVDCLQAARALGVRPGYPTQAGAALLDTVAKGLQKENLGGALDEKTQARIIEWAREMREAATNEKEALSAPDLLRGMQTVSPKPVATVPATNASLHLSTISPTSYGLPSTVDSPSPIYLLTSRGLPTAQSSPKMLPECPTPVGRYRTPQAPMAAIDRRIPGSSDHACISRNVRTRTETAPLDTSPSRTQWKYEGIMATPAEPRAIAAIRKEVQERIISEVRSKRLVEDILCANGDGEVMCLTDSCAVSLRCPISLTRIQVPVRGWNCKHIDCFDLDTYVTLNSRGRAKWRCPHCERLVGPADLAVDERFQRILAEATAADRVVIRRDGSWEVESLRSASEEKRMFAMAKSDQNSERVLPVDEVIVID